MRSPNTPWGKDFKSVTRNDAPLRKFVLEIDGQPCTLDEYNAEQKRLALAMRAAQRGSK
jgi:hypothetical protein